MQTRALVGALVFALACARPAPTATIHTKGGAVTVGLELAADEATRQRGLMYRDKLADGHGMLFVFDDETEHSFWMKNTLIPLDMIFISSDGRIVGILPNTTPLSTASVSVGRPSKYVLEVAGGYAARAGIATGDRIDLDLPEGT